MTPIESIAADLRQLSEDQRENILLRFVAREKNSSMMKQILRERQERLDLRLVQRGYMAHEV